MPFVDPRVLAVDNIGPPLRTLCAYTLVDYTAAGTTAAAVDDVVVFSTTGNWYVKRAPDNAVSFFGKVVKIEKAAVGTAVGYVMVEWYDVVRFVRLTTDDLATCTLGNAAIKDGDTTVADNFDAGGTTGNLKVVAKSGTAGAGTICAALVAA